MVGKTASLVYIMTGP